MIILHVFSTAMIQSWLRKPLPLQAPPPEQGEIGESFGPYQLGKFQTTEILCCGKLPDWPLEVIPLSVADSRELHSIYPSSVGIGGEPCAFVFLHSLQTKSYRFHLKARFQFVHKMR